MQFLVVLLALASITVPCSYAFANDASIVTYSNLLDGRRLVEFDLTEGRRSVGIGDRAYRLELCPRVADVFCVEAEGFHFAVPRDITAVSQSWTHGDYTYTAVRRSMLEVLGKVLDVFVIRSTQDKDEYSFLYSIERGLVGFELRYEDRSSMYMVASQCGLGASSDCIRKK